MVHKGFTTQGKKRNIFVEDVMVAKGYGHIQIGCASFKKIKAYLTGLSQGERRLWGDPENDLKEISAN